MVIQTQQPHRHSKLIHPALLGDVGRADDEVFHFPHSTIVMQQDKDGVRISHTQLHAFGMAGLEEINGTVCQRAGMYFRKCPAALDAQLGDDEPERLSEIRFDGPA